MNKIRLQDKKYKIQMLGFFLTGFLLCGCASGNNAGAQTAENNREEKDYSILLPGTYDSKDTAVFLSKDEDEGTITFFNLTKERNYTLKYDGTTSFYDKYDSALALNQIAEGTIVDVTFLKNSKKLNTMQVSKEAWSNRQVSQFTFNESKRNVTIGSDTYKFSDDLVIMQGNRQMELMDINAVDVLTVNGIGSSIYSVQIEKGHGYLKLSGDEYFIGGWIEVGQSLIREITEGMLLTVPEGTYDVTVSHQNYNSVKRVVINRNEETTLDLSDLQGESEQTGTVLFSVTPSDAKVFVDGNEVDISGPVTLAYGIHQLMAKADGYKTSTSYLKVAQESAGINIVLDKADEEDEEESQNDSNDTNKDDNQDNTDDKNNTNNKEEQNTDSSDKNTTVSGSDSNSGSVSDNQSGDSADSGGSSSATSYYKVYIDNPSGVEVYLDGNYVGIAPVSFKKVSGMHVITLRKKGYETRSYTISVDSEKRDASYSFVDLDPEE